MNYGLMKNAQNDWIKKCRLIAVVAEYKLNV
jgi:hypothetical protein